ncbi:MAG TPA: tetratricopeptide repeat protein [Fimbriiglobus sp.]|nr:tetratricopeptide repeat protein [Fimbriiglobus sp.]
MRRTLLAAAAFLVVAAGVGYYLWPRQVAAGPPPPPIPADWTDPPIREVVETRRRSVLAAPQSGADWGELGMVFDAHEATAEAETCYQRAMDLDPNDARWPYLLAEHFNQRSGAESDKEEAVRLYRRAADCPPPSPAHRAAALLSLADLLTELGRGDEATGLYQQVYDANSSDPWAAYRVGMELADRGDTEKASRILLGLARDPYARKKSAAAMAELTRRAGRAKEADGFEYAAGLLPPDHYWANPFTEEVAGLQRGRRALMKRYVVQEAARDDRATVHTATTLADQYPSVETQMLLLRALVNASDYPAALAVADDILQDEAGRQLVTAHSFLGLARLGLADRAEAEGRKADADRLLAQAAEALGESVRLKSDYAPGHLYRSKALLRLGRLTEAEASARAGVACRPEEWEGYLALADVLAAAGRKADAVAATEQAVKLAHPNEPRPRRALEALKK